MKQEDKTEKDEIIIYVNKKEIHVEEHSLTGKQILVKARMEADEYDLFLIRGQNSEKIEAEQTVPLEDGLRFHAIKKNVPYG